MAFGTAELVQQWFNTAAFLFPGDGKLGTAARNVGYGPGAVSIDTSLMKDFHFTEQRFLQLRGEFFTIINGPNFGLPNTTRGNAAFGTIISAADGRQIQIGMRIVF